MTCSQVRNDARSKSAPKNSVKAEEKESQGNNEERGEDNVRGPMRPGHDARKPDKTGDDKKPRAARPIKRGENGGEAEHVGGVAGGERFAGLGRRGNFGRFDPNRFAQGENLRFDAGQTDHAGLSERFRGAGATEGFFERFDEEALDQGNGKKQASDHGSRTETAFPDNDQRDEDHDGKPKVQAREHGHELVESRPAAVGVEVEEETLVERGRHMC